MGYDTRGEGVTQEVFRADQAPTRESHGDKYAADLAKLGMRWNSRTGSERATDRGSKAA